MIDKEKLGTFLKDLEYVARINPVCALVGSRTYIEAVLNMILFKKFNYPEDELYNMKLYKKIELLDKKGILKKRTLIEIENIKYRGDDAAHQFFGTQSDAISALETCKKLNRWFMENYSNLTASQYESDTFKIFEKDKNNNLALGKRYRGIIKNFGKANYGFVKEFLTQEDIYFHGAEQDMKNPEKLKIGDEVLFRLEENATENGTKYKAFDMKLIGTVMNIDVSKSGHKFGFIDGKHREDIYFSLESFPESGRESIEPNIEIAFKLKRGTNKDEAYEIEIL